MTLQTGTAYVFPAFLAGITLAVPSLPSTTLSEMRIHPSCEHRLALNLPEMRRIASLAAVQLLLKDKGLSRQGNTRNEWSLGFDNETPLDLQLSMGAGENKLTLKSLSLRRVDISTGVGQAIIHLPRNIGVRVDAKHKQGMNVEVRGGIGGIGEIKLVVD